MKPRWVTVAEQDIGQKEVGINDSPWIRRMLAKLGATWMLGQPWCGAAVAAWMKACDIKPPKAWYRAKSWADWGLPLAEPIEGCVVVFTRTGGGHVGLVVGETALGNLLVLGGNQNDSVKVSSFKRDRVTAYRWPVNEPIPADHLLAMGDGEMSHSEA